MTSEQQINELRDDFERHTKNLKGLFDYEFDVSELGPIIRCRSYCVEGALDCKWNNGQYQLTCTKVIDGRHRLELSWALEETAQEIEDAACTAGATLCRREMFDKIARLVASKGGSCGCR